MLIGKVVNNVWATRKDDRLRGLKLMVVEIEGFENRTIVAADYIGAGEGDKVIITTGSQGEAMSALTRMANGDHKKVTITPNDMVIAMQLQHDMLWWVLLEVFSLDIKGH